MIRSKTLFIFALIIFPALLSAQLNHFIYLQTEGKQPFYAKINKKVYSSSSSGYLIIPKLKDDTYTITLGFPKNESGEQTFTCTINNKDAGYIVKNFGDKGWGLFNLQTLDVVMADITSDKTQVAKNDEKVKPDEFSSMLSEVVNDPSIKQAPKTNTSVKEEPIVAKNQDKPAAKSTIIKQQATSTEKGTELIYTDNAGATQDTITIFIPAENEIKSNAEEAGAPKDAKAISESKPVEEKAKPVEEKEDQVKEVNKDVINKQAEKKNESADNKKFLPIEVKPVADSSVQVSSSIPTINSNCKVNAGDEDFLKLRKKMASADNDDEMIATAQKFLKAKCYTTDQIRNLSVLFLKDEGKYRFFDLAYSFVSDSQNFSTLQSQLTDTYYVSRFQAMMRH